MDTQLLENLNKENESKKVVKIKLTDEEKKEKRKEYQKKYREENKEKIKNYECNKYNERQNERYKMSIKKNAKILNLIKDAFRKNELTITNVDKLEELKTLLK